MNPLIVLFTGGILIIVIVSIILGIIRIIRAATRNNNPPTNYQNYNQPYQQPGNPNNPASNPYGTNPYAAPRNPNDPTQPPAFPSNAYGNTPPPTPDYSQPNYQNQTYNPNQQYNPNTQYNTNPYNPQNQARSTSISGMQQPYNAQQYSTHMGDMPPRRNRTGLVLGIIGGVVLLIGGLGWFIYAKAEAAKKYTTSDFNLGYENPTDNTYTLILDDWDTIKVEPWTGSSDLDYTYEMGKDTFHWKMLDENGKAVADTFLMREDLEDWYYDQTAKGYSQTPTIILNPSRTQYVFWTLWYGSAGDDYCMDTQFGDSTYWVDAYTTTEAVIFDERHPDWATDIGDAEKYSSEDQAQFLLTIDDFHNLYHRIFSSDKDELDVFNDYRNSLIELYNSARDDADRDGYIDYSEETKLNALDGYIPPTVSSNTDARDFALAIDYVKSQQSFFEDADYRKYQAVVDSADIILTSGFVATAKNEPYHEMEFITYYVILEGFWNDQPRRSESYHETRDGDGYVTY